VERNRLADVLKKHQLLVEYNFYIPKSMDEQDVPGGDVPPAPDAPVDDAPAPPAPEDLGGAPAPTEPTPDAPAIDAPMEVPNPSEKGEVEVDITDLVNSTKDTKDKIEGTNELLNSLISKFDELETRMTSFDEILNRIDKIEQDFEKRLPTPVEKLEMRSMDSYPYSVKLSDFWSEEVDDSIDGEEKTQGEEYILTPEDVKKDYNASTIKTSFNVQKPEDQDFQR
jgi:hypothetical protein